MQKAMAVLDWDDPNRDVPALRWDPERDAILHHEAYRQQFVESAAKQAPQSQKVRPVSALRRDESSVPKLKLSSEIEALVEDTNKWLDELTEELAAIAIISSNKPGFLKSAEDFVNDRRASRTA